MERVIHICGAPLIRHSSGGVAHVVVFGNVRGQEIQACPNCGLDLADADMYTVEHTDAATIATAINGETRMVFPFNWRERGRGYTYASSAAEREPRQERKDGARWVREQKIGLRPFERWMLALEDWQAE